MFQLHFLQNNSNKLASRHSSFYKKKQCEKQPISWKYWIERNSGQVDVSNAGMRLAQNTENAHSTTRLRKLKSSPFFGWANIVQWKLMLSERELDIIVVK